MTPEDPDLYARFCSCCEQYKPIEQFHKDAYANTGYRSWCSLCESKKRRTTIPTPETLDGFKWCPGCEAIHPLDEFGTDVRRKDGRRGRCKPCWRLQKREHNKRLRSDPAYREAENEKNRQRLASKTRDRTAEYERRKARRKEKRDAAIAKSGDDVAAPAAPRDRTAEYEKRRKQRQESPRDRSAEYECRRKRRQEDPEYAAKEHARRAAQRAKEAEAARLLKEEEAKAALELGAKPCLTCKEVKPFSAYWKRASSMDGHSANCRDCIAARRNAVDPEDAELVDAWKKKRQSFEAQVLARREANPVLRKIYEDGQS